MSDKSSDEKSDGKNEKTKKTKRKKRRGDDSDDDDDADGKSERKKPYKHRGMIIEGKIGALGCLGRHCRDEANHNSAPGLALGGFFGVNVLGFIDLGLEGAWGRLRPRAYSGRNVFDLYSINGTVLSAKISEEMGVPSLPIDFSTLTVGEVKSTAVHAGPTIRVHVIPRGRLSAYIGLGAHYQLWRNAYDTLGGDFRLSFHGVSVPASVGLGYYVLRRLNLNAEFTYDHTAWLAASIRHPDLDFVAPLLLLEEAALEAGTDLKKDLPNFWSLVLSARVRF